MSKKKPAAETDQPLTFEAALAQLEAITTELDAGNLDLADALTRYGEGVRYLRHCQKLLDATQQKIELLVSIDEEGNPTTEPFDDTATLE